MSGLDDDRNETRKDVNADGVVRNEIVRLIDLLFVRSDFLIRTTEEWVFEIVGYVCWRWLTSGV